MNLIKKLFGPKKLDTRLFGQWTVDKSDEITINTLGNVTLTFTPEGKLIYEIIEDEKIQIINMTFLTVDNIIFSDQPSNPRKEQTIYKFQDEQHLILEFEGQKTKFIKRLD